MTFARAVPIRASEMKPTSFSLQSTRPVHRGFDTLDLKEAKALLKALAV
jgi:hypothetical protein